MADELNEMLVGRMSGLLNQANLTEQEALALIDEANQPQETPIGKSIARLLGAAIPAALAGAFGGGRAAGSVLDAGGKMLTVVDERDEKRYENLRKSKAAKAELGIKKAEGLRKQASELGEIPIEIATAVAKEEALQPLKLERAAAGRSDVNVAYPKELVSADVEKTININKIAASRLTDLADELEAQLKKEGLYTDKPLDTAIVQAKGKFAGTELGKLFARLSEQRQYAASAANQGRPTDKDFDRISAAVGGDITSSGMDIVAAVRSAANNVRKDARNTLVTAGAIRGFDPEPLYQQLFGDQRSAQDQANIEIIKRAFSNARK